MIFFPPSVGGEELEKKNERKGGRENFINFGLKVL